MKLSPPLKGAPRITGRFEKREQFWVNGALTLPFHYGVDWAVPAGTPVHAIGAGTVYVAGWDNSGYGGGWQVFIDHGNSITSHYMHLRNRPPVKTGQQVRQGQQIGVVGSTGLSTGNHLHLEIRKQGVAVNPLPLLTHDTTDIGENEMFAAVIDGKEWYLVIPQGTGKPKAVILYGESQVAERGEFPVVYFSHANAKKAFWSAVDRA